MRSSTSDDYLTSGIAYAFHPHRDTWYSAPMCQLNWWLPIYPIATENCLAFHPKYWYTPTKNSSRVYNYAAWNATSRQEAAKHVKTDTRVQPKPEEELELDPQIRPLVEPGGIVLFSAAQMHSSVTNTSGRRVSASTSAPSTSTTSRRGEVRRTSTRSAPGRRWATTCAAATSPTSRTS